MIDPVITQFLEDRKEKWLKGKVKSNTNDDEKEKFRQQAAIEFSLEVWLPNAAKRAKQLFLVSHPGKFSHPSAKISSVIATSSTSNDGFLRTGNVVVELDVFGNAAAMDVYKFLNLQLKDGKTILTHLENNTSVIKEQLFISSVTFAEIAHNFLLIKENGGTAISTSCNVKQVFFPVGSEYHLLSILNPSGIMFKLKERINTLRFSDEAKAARDSKKKNTPSVTGFSEMYELSVIGYGGTKPQNISVLNNQNGGTAYLLRSMPPDLTPRSIQPPKTNFFSNTLWADVYKDQFQKLHAVFIDERNNIHIRNKRDRIVKNIVYLVVDRLWMVRYLEAGWSDTANYRQLPKHQKIWLDQHYATTRDNNTEWIIPVKNDFTRWFVNTYTKLLGKNALGLGDDQLLYFNTMISECEEALR